MSSSMSNMVGVRFRPSDKMQYFDSSGIELEAGDRVLVETPEGVREGVIAIAPGQVVFSDLRGPMDAVIQKASD
jgi:cell fate regulator YaaT (PSP1 superfamily)